MATQNLSPLTRPFFGEVLAACLDQQIALVGRIVLPKLYCCEFEDEFGCGELGVITEIESEREYCPRHFRQVSLWRAVDQRVAMTSDLLKRFREVYESIPPEGDNRTMFIHQFVGYLSSGLHSMPKGAELWEAALTTCGREYAQKGGAA